MMNLLSYKLIYFKQNIFRILKMAALKTLFDHLIVPINAIYHKITSYCINKMTDGMCLRHIRCPLLCSHTNASIVSKASGTIQSRFATRTAQCPIPSYSSIALISAALLEQHPCHIARARSVVYPLLFSSQYSVDADVDHALINHSLLAPEGNTEAMVHGS